MTTKQALILSGVIVLLVGVTVGFIYYVVQTRHQRELTQSLLNQTNEKLHSANLDIGRARTREGDAQALIDQLRIDIQKEIQQRQAVLVMYSLLEAKYTQAVNNVRTITKVVYEDKIIDLPKGKIFVRLDDGNYKEITSLTYNYKDYHIEINGDSIKETLSYKLNQRFAGVLAKTRMKDGSSDYYLRLSELDKDGKSTQDLKLEKFEVIETNPKEENEFHWFDPYLDGYFGVTYSNGITYTGEVGISLISFGIGRPNNFLRFIRFGIGVTDGKLSTSFSPVLWNFGRLIKPLSNLWLTPIVGWNFGSDSWLTGMGVSVVF
jgi:hypothetical protein